MRREVGNRHPVAASARTRLVRNGDISLAVYEFGPADGIPVVLVHGWPDTHHLWDGVVPLLSDRYRVISYDTRGYGQSSAPTQVSAYELNRLATDFFAVVEAVSPTEPVHVVAHDWGSVQVWEAVCEPGADQYVASFTSISGPNLDHLAIWMRRGVRSGTPRGIRGALSQCLSSAYTTFFMLPVLPGLFFRLVGTEKMWKLFLRVVEGTSPDQISLAPTLKQDMISGLRFYRANIIARMVAPRERRTTVPVQLLVNTRDIAVRPAGYDDTAEWADQVVRHDLLRGHWLPYSDPAAIAGYADAFIQAKSE
ncbi:alpha/beta fold hydrolase [Nocardia alba]|uniref:Pimeloyl-ACP methyl ester carboxylesterase n=1 Tax=Nocardia alba TaxID=225051 RepID=A0A4R1FUG3_9NOCA|nr:alpha/beta fold hydrolase [Nocardia alba]TCJ97434.1 pimeloyl-ACP methyl ester carboxylesterase [Nocardia alba]